MRPSLLKTHPTARAVTMRELVGIANAIEQEAVRRYGELAALMERRGERATAEAFRRMQREEQDHVSAVAALAAEHRQAVPGVDEFTWQLPPEIAASWNEVAGSALLTPYRAFAIAVRNEERAFALYSYLAAQAEDDTVAAEAEKLAAEELAHAALLRRWRRAAYRDEHPGRLAPPPDIDTVEALQAMLAEHEAVIVDCHRTLAGRLRRLGDEDSAALLLGLLDEPSYPPAGAAACQDPDCRDDDPVRLLVAAQKPLERLSEAIERVLERAEGDLVAAAELALMNVVGRLARVAAQIERRSQD